MAELFGSPNGDIAFHQDQDTQAATQERFAQIQHLGAMTEQTQMQTQVAAQKMQREQMMLQTLANMKPPPPGQSPADRMTDLGGALSEGGFVKEGADLLNKASEIKNREELARNASIRAKTALFEQKMKQFDSLNNLLASSYDEESHQKALMVWLNENPGETIPPEMMHYDPATNMVLQNATRAGQAELRRQQAETNEDEKDDYRKSSLAARQQRNEALEKHQKVLEDIAERRLQQQKKAGGGKAPSLQRPNTVEIQKAATMISKDYPDLEPDTPLGAGEKAARVNSAAIDLAEEAKVLSQRTKISMTEAMTQVYGNMRKSGAFQTTPKEKSTMDTILHRDPGKKTDYKPTAKEPALPYVKGVTKPEVGKIYDPGNGSKWRFDGNKMVEVQ